MLPTCSSPCWRAASCTASARPLRARWEVEKQSVGRLRQFHGAIPATSFSRARVASLSTSFPLPESSDELCCKTIREWHNSLLVTKLILKDPHVQSLNNAS